MRLWVDDERKHPVGWSRAFSTAEAREILSTGEVRFASIDHDLIFGLGTWDMDAYEENGYELIKWMAREEIWPPLGIRLHSDNATGRNHMAEIVEAHAPYSHKSTDSEGKIVFTQDQEPCCNLGS